MVKLIIREQGTERVYEVVDDVTTIGRTQDNHIPIKDPRSSRKHCQVVNTGDGYKLVDLKSRNGVFLNGKPAQEEPLEPGDRIEIGDTLIFFEKAPKGKAVRKVKKLALKITSGPDKGRIITLKDDLLLIGTHDAADLKLTDEKVSSHHAQLLKIDGGYTVVDLNSENGVFLNGKKVTRETIKPGGVLTVGGTNLRMVEGRSGGSGRVKKGKKAKKSKSKRTPKAKTSPPPVVEDPTDSVPEIEVDTDSDDELDVVDVGVEEDDEDDVPRVEISTESFSEVESVKFLSQADFESVDLEGMAESTDTTAVLTTIVVSVFFVAFLVLGLQFVIKVFHNPPADPKPSGDNVVRNWSFELGTELSPEHWRLEKGASLDKNEALGGKISLRLNGNPQLVPFAKSDPIGVSSKKYYILRSYLKLDSAGPTGMKLHWTKEGTNFYQESFTTLWQGTNDWREVTAIVIPPRGADRVAIECFTLGKVGTAWFDRLSLEERGDESQADVKGPFQIELAKDFVVEMDALGRITLGRGDPLRRFFVRGQLQIFELGPDSRSQQSLVKVTVGPTMKKDKFYLEGQIYHKGTDTWYTFIQEVYLNGDQIEVSYFIKGDNPLPQVGLAMSKVGTQQIQLVNSEGRQPAGKEFSNEGIIEMIWGRENSKVVFLYPKAVKVESKPESDEAGTFILSSQADTNRFVFHLSKSSQLERMEQKRLLAEAKQLEDGGEFEKAMEVWKKVMGKFPYNQKLFRQAEQKVKELTSMQQGFLRELENLKSDYELFQNSFILESSRKKVEALKKNFPTLAKRADVILQELSELEKQRNRKDNRQTARRLLQRGKQVLGTQLEGQDSGTMAIAAAYFRAIVQHYNQDPVILREAQLKLKLIREKMVHVLGKDK